MKKLLFLINFCSCEVLWIPEIPDEQDPLPGGENMVVCPPGSEFVKEIKGKALKCLKEQSKREGYHILLPLPDFEKTLFFKSIIESFLKAIQETFVIMD